MSLQSRFLKSTAVICAALTASLALATAEPAYAGAKTGTWKYYPNGNAPGAPSYSRRHARGWGGHRSYGYRPAYGSRQPAYGYGSQQPAYGYGYQQPAYGYRQPAYENDDDDYGRPDAGAAVAAGIIGLAAGAIAAGAVSQRRGTRVSCTHYRSYNPRTGTFIGRNGKRYAC